MARVLVLSADLMFGSRLLASLSADGHDVELIATAAAVQERLRSAQDGADVLIVDLTDERHDGVEALRSLRAEGLVGERPATLAFFSHVETAVRERAESAGFDLIVPRSRIAREAGALVAKLTSG